MAGPIFTRQDTELNGVFSSDKAKLVFTGAASTAGVNGVLVQGMNFTYAQAITRLYELGAAAAANKTNVYYVGGRTNGQAGLNRVIGPNATIAAMYTQYGDVCKACTNNMELQLDESDCCTGPGRGGQAGMTYTLKFCVITQVGVSLQAQDMIINEQVQLMFSGLDVA